MRTDGSALALIGKFEPETYYDGAPLQTLHKIDLWRTIRDTARWQPIRNDAYQINQGLWAKDGFGILASALIYATEPKYQLIWIRADPKLPTIGLIKTDAKNLRWGK